MIRRAFDSASLVVLAAAALLLASARPAAATCDVQEHDDPRQPHRQGRQRGKAKALETGGNFSIDVKRETDPLNVTVTTELVVGKTSTLSGGSAADNVGVIAGSSAAAR